MSKEYPFEKYTAKVAEFSALKADILSTSEKVSVEVKPSSHSRIREGKKIENEALYFSIQSYEYIAVKLMVMKVNKRCISTNFGFMCNITL